MRMGDSIQLRLIAASKNIYTTGTFSGLKFIDSKEVK